MLTVLLKNEFLKTFKRLAFWVTFLSVSAIMTISFGEEFLRAQGDPEQTFALPGAWRDILTDDTEIILIFGTVILILLLSSEFSWRTARQNVIDGLSKGQFFLAKLLLIPIMGLTFLAANVGIGGLFAFLGTDTAVATEPVLRGLDLRVMMGVFVAFAGYASLGLFSSLAIRNSGPAMAMWFFYVVLIERLVGGAMVGISEGLRPVVRYLPVNVFNAWHNWLQHDPAALERAVQRATEAGNNPPQVWDGSVLTVATIAWLAVLIGGSFLWFGRRDL